MQCDQLPPAPAPKTSQAWWMEASSCKWKINPSFLKLLLLCYCVAATKQATDTKVQWVCYFFLLELSLWWAGIFLYLISSFIRIYWPSIFHIEHLYPFFCKRPQHLCTGDPKHVYAFYRALWKTRFAQIKIRRKMDKCSILKKLIREQEQASVWNFLLHENTDQTHLAESWERLLGTRRH